MPEELRPDVRPQLREFLAWYEGVLGRIESGAIVAPGEQERLTKEMSKSVNLGTRISCTRFDPAKGLAPQSNSVGLRLLASRASRVGGLRALGRDRMQGQFRHLTPIGI
jgi:hypothetical protein